MGLFGGKQTKIPSTPTEMDADWFIAWASDIARKIPSQRLRELCNAQTDAEVFGELYVKATAVIDHDCRDYVHRYCGNQALKAYLSYVELDKITPWGLVSVTVALNPTREEWHQFIIDDMKQKLARFAAIMIDPSIVN